MGLTNRLRQNGLTGPSDKTRSLKSAARHDFNYKLLQVLFANLNNFHDREADTLAVTFR
jgi:hypothetical protein